MSFIASALKAHRAQGLYRELNIQRGLVDFSSNDYLSLAGDEFVRRSLIEELARGCPLGATGSPLVSGYTDDHERVESFLARTFQVPSALLFSSGFMANLGVMRAFSNCEFYSDELNHASLIDGMRLSRSPVQIFAHNDLNHLESLLKKSRARHRAIVTESVFSQDGDLAPLDGLMSVSRRFNSWLIVDEAHATGVYGQTGLGRLEGLHEENVITIHTASKALGGQGAFVLSSLDVRELVVNRARSFIYSTGLAPLMCLQIEYALKALLGHKLGDGNRLLARAEEFRKAIQLPLTSRSPIIPVVLGSNERALDASRTLSREGLHVRAMRFPTVARGSERLRITLKSTHKPREIETLLHCLKQILNAHDRVRK